MKRSELQEELAQVRKWTDTDYGNSKLKAEEAERRILNWYDEVSREMEYVGSLRSNLKLTVSEKVALEIEVQELRQLLEHATRTKKEEEDDDQ